MKNIHLTFDDGPHPTNTPIALKILEKHGIKATFFVVGNRLSSYGYLLKEIVKQGHRVGNHSYSHPNFSKLSAQAIKDEINKTAHGISKYIPVDPIIRPPYGALNGTVRSVIAELQYTTVLWSVDTEDWKRKPDGWVSYGIEQIKKRQKSLVLMHDIHSTSVNHLDNFIQQIKKIEGSHFVDLASIINDTPKPTPPVPPPSSTYYVVRKGDTLSSIAKKFYQNSQLWPRIYEANKDIIKNPNIIYEGMRLVIP